MIGFGLPSRETLFSTSVRALGRSHAMRETVSERERRTRTIIGKLKRYYPDSHCALHHTNPLELLVATILSAQCTDERVNQVTPALFKKYPTAGEYAEAPSDELESMIRSTGFFRAKAKSLKGMGEKIVKEFGGQVPESLEDLVLLPGVGRKTANVVMGNAFHKATGIVVDTHVKRLSYRLGLTNAKTPEKIEPDLIKLVAQKDWIQFSHWLIFHGRKVCKARKPECNTCFLEGDCPQRGVKR